jgi:hypothetical protein
MSVTNEFEGMQFHGGCMRNKFLLLFATFLFICGSVVAQVATKTGSIYGKILDDKGAPLPGVNVTLESELIPAQSATSGPSGGFRFANLPPGMYSVTFSIEGFTEVRQEDVRVSTGSQVQLEISLKPSLSEEFTVIGETPIVDSKKTGQSDTFNRDYLDEVPSGRDPWVIIDQTTSIDVDRYNVAGSESGQQAGFVARGGSDDNTVWNFDGVNVTDPQALGASPSYYDFDAFEELQISTGGNDPSIPTGGVAVNIVTKRAGNRWEGDGSFFFVNESLQGTNTPDELIAQGVDKSNRIDEIKDYGFNIGGPIIRDKLFAWGAYRKNEIGLVTTAGLPDFTELTVFNAKANVSWTSQHESQFGFNDDNKKKNGRASQGVAIQAPETLWTQSGSNSILEGIWTAQHTWIPNDRTILTARYGYNGNGFSLIPQGGKDIPMIYLSSVPRWENTNYYVAPIDRPGKDFSADLNYFKENMMGGDHEFRFGFEYKTDSLHTFSSYGNGVLIIDYYQSAAGGPLTSGSLLAQHFIDGHDKIDRTSFYVTDTFRKDRVTLNIGFRFDHQTGEAQASSIPAVPGFESFVGPLDFPGIDPGINFNNFSPRIGATFDVSGDGKTLIRGNFARYYDTFNPAYLNHQNPTFVYNGAIFNYENRNGDRTVTADEISSGPNYYGGLDNPIFNLDAFLNNRLIDGDFKNSGSMEYLVGFEHQLMADLSIGVTYTHRDYFDTTAILPVGISQNDFIQVGNYTRETLLGNFSVPIYSLSFTHDGRTILTNIEDYKNHYNGVDITVRKRMSNDFMMNGSLTLQRQKASYDGGDSAAFAINDGGLSGQTFPFDPGQMPFLKDQPYAFAAGGSGKAGVYPYSEWQLKLSGVYQFPWDVSVGAFGRYQQGYPYVIFGSFSDNTLAGALGTSTHRILLEPFGSRRFDNIFTLDLQFEKGFDFSNYGRLSLMANLFNVTNTNTVIRRVRSASSGTFNNIDENISPRALRLGLRYSF